jgi:hypothetical protein
MMASITVSNGLDGIMAIARKRVAQVWESQRAANAEAAEFGAKTAQSYTASRPGATTGKGGRIASGDMIDALRHRQVSFDPRLIVSQYGFVDEFEDYFKMQTVTGFTHNRSGDFIAPTFALRDSIGPTEDFARGAAGRAV